MSTILLEFSSKQKTAKLWFHHSKSRSVGFHSGALNGSAKDLAVCVISLQPSGAVYGARALGAGPRWRPRPWPPAPGPRNNAAPGDAGCHNGRAVGRQRGQFSERTWRRNFLSYFYTWTQHECVLMRGVENLHNVQVCWKMMKVDEDFTRTSEAIAGFQHCLVLLDWDARVCVCVGGGEWCEKQGDPACEELNSPRRERSENIDSFYQWHDYTAGKRWL